MNIEFLCGIVDTFFAITILVTWRQFHGLLLNIISFDIRHIAIETSMYTNSVQVQCNESAVEETIKILNMVIIPT